MVAVMKTDMGEVDNGTMRPKVVDAKGILKQNREFLDYFWDIAKPEREIRLKAVENLIEHLKNSEKSDELKYSLKRLVDSLSHTREDARSGFSLALAQLLSVFEEISLKSALDSIKGKYNLQTPNKKAIRIAVFGNFFGVLALSQSTRLHKEPEVLLECVHILQSLSQYREYLKDLPRKTMVDILSETSKEVFEEVLFNALKSDLTSALNTPEQLELLLVAIQKFPSVLKPKKLKKLLGTTTVITDESLPKLVGVLKTAARSVKKDAVLPPVALDLLQASLREESFEMFWNEAIIKGMMSEMPGHTHYLSFRLLGAALPLLSVSQIEFVLTGDVMRHYGEHVLSAQLPDRFKFSPEMDKYISEFLQVCTDADRQLAVVLGFTQLTNQGYPVVPSFWKVLEHMVLPAQQKYVEWLQEAFCDPQLDRCLDFTTRRQMFEREDKVENDSCVARFRTWIIQRLAFIVENHQIKKDEDLVMNVARFIFFHAFFDVKKSTSEIPETKRALALPIDKQTRASMASAFYSILQSLNMMPVLGDLSETESLNSRRIVGFKADGSMWIYCLVQYAATLLDQSKYAQIVQAFSPEQRQAWDSMLESVEDLRKKAKKSSSPEHAAFQNLFLLIGIQMFKSPEESLDLLKDLRSCMERAQAKKSKKKKAANGKSSEEEPHWVEVIVEILLSLLSQPSRLIRNVCKVVFTRICPHLTQGALNSILNVLDPNKDEEESGVMVTDEKEKKKHKVEEGEDEEEGDEDEEEDEEGSDSSDDDEDDEEDEAMDDGEDVDQNFRLDLMKVLQGQNALVKEEDGSDEEEMDDAAMMKLDGSLSALFLEQKKKIQAKKDEKDRLRKEKVLVRDFKIKVLDMVEVFLLKQGSSPLVLSMVDPLLSVIETGMSSETSQQEQDYLRKAANIFKNQLCRGKYYCREIDGREAELHEMLERLVGRAQKLSDSSVSLYYFSAALYVVKVLRGVVNEQESTPSEANMGKLDVARVTSCFRDALTSSMTRRKTPLTGAMFIDLFTRFPVLCVNLLDTAVENITGGLREHQQGQACAMVLRAVQSKDVKNLMSHKQWAELYEKIVRQLIKTFENVPSKNKTVHEKMVKAMELCQFIVKTVKNAKMPVKLELLQDVLKTMNDDESLQKPGQLEDIYWSVMKFFGVVKPKMQKVKKVVEVEQTEKTTKKKKGFLPETKKRKNRMKSTVLEGKEPSTTTETPEGTSGKKKKKNKKRKRQGEETQAQTPAKKAKQQQKKKKQKGGDKK
ncbi:myb-binding protein 1A-like protein [Misgurnus anguillicaudatus]|uniref:myb-binding protein 1A-like protein n=1 Tax=Misgurnus anguillicaudatus TaxID=75329 RepID=UPI003CCF0314